MRPSRRLVFIMNRAGKSANRLTAAWRCYSETNADEKAVSVFRAEVYRFPALAEFTAPI
jgi:hypothetical protein